MNMIAESFNFIQLLAEYAGRLQISYITKKLDCNYFH